MGKNWLEEEKNFSFLVIAVAEWALYRYYPPFILGKKVFEKKNFLSERAR